MFNIDALFSYFTHENNIIFIIHAASYSKYNIIIIICASNKFLYNLLNSKVKDICRDKDIKHDKK
jgi:hypothetical protein